MSDPASLRTIQTNVTIRALYSDVFSLIIVIVKLFLFPRLHLVIVDSHVHQRSNSHHHSPPPPMSFGLVIPNRVLVLDDLVPREFVAERINANLGHRISRSQARIVKYLHILQLLYRSSRFLLCTISHVDQGCIRSVRAVVWFPLPSLDDAVFLQQLQQTGIADQVETRKSGYSDDAFERLIRSK